MKPKLAQTAVRAPQTLALLVLVVAPIVSMADRLVEGRYRGGLAMLVPVAIGCLSGYWICMGLERRLRVRNHLY